MTSNFLSPTGNPEPALRAISEAGFTLIHWCHHWNTDFLYDTAEIAQIRKWISNYGLQVLDLHASGGKEKVWDAEETYSRAAGQALVANRLQMAAELGTDVIILHASSSRSLETQQRSLETLEPIARSAGVRIALENLDTMSYTRLPALLAQFDPDYLGVCYDTGHGNIHSGGPDWLETVNDRLISVHVHDNDGISDQHRIPFSGNVPWETVMALIARSAYKKGVNMETTMRTYESIPDSVFLGEAHAAGVRLSSLIES